MTETVVDDRRRWWEWALLALGWATVGIAVLGVVGVIPHFAGEVPWRQVAIWTFGLAALHDLVVAPLVGLVGIAIGRVVPPAARGAVAAASVISAIVVAVSYARLRGFGVDPSEPSFLAGDASADVIRVVVLVWVVCLGAAAAGAVTRRRAGG